MNLCINNLLKKSIFLCIIGLLWVPGVFAETAEGDLFRIGVLPFSYYENVTKSQAQIISQIVKTHLSERQILQLVELNSNELMEETAFQLSGAVENQDVLELGNRHDLNYILSGSCDTQNGNVQLTVQLTAMPGGRVVYGKTAELVKENIESDISLFIQALSGELEGIVIGRSLEDIETLIALHRWEDAYTMLRDYIDIYGENTETVRLKQQIFEHLYRNIQERIYRISKIKPTSEWQQLRLLMLTYYQDERSGKVKDDLLLSLQEIHELYSIQRNSELNNAVESIKSQAEDGNIDYARQIYRETQKNYPYSVDLAQVEKYLDTIESELLAKTADNLLSGHKYRQAAYYAEKALFLFPASVEYLELVQKIEAEQKRDQELDRTVYSKRNSWAVSKRPLHTVKLQTSMIFYRDKLNEVFIDGGFPAAGIVWHKYSPILLPLYQFIDTEAKVSWGTNEQNMTGGELYADFLHIEILGGIGGALRFHKFTFELALRAGIGVLQRDLDMDDFNSSVSGVHYDYTGSVGLKGAAAYSFGTAYEAGLGIGIYPMYVIKEGIVNRTQASVWLGRSF